MKLLHTSDWHLGHEIASFGRIAEQRDFLRQIADIAGEEQPDLMVVAGDVFHTATPSNAVMTLLAEGLDLIRRAAPGMRIVVIAGNHDSGSRLESSRAPWLHLGVDIIGRIGRADDGSVDFSRHLLTVSDPATGSPVAIVAALPHLFARGYPAVDAAPGDSCELRRRFMAAFSRELHSCCEAMPEVPVVAVAHLAVASCDTTGHDRDFIGGMEFLELADFGIDYDYLALGHIHRAQSFRGPGESVARYCGTPIAIDFDESHTHSVTIATIGARGTRPEIRTVALSEKMPLVTIGGTGSEPPCFEDALTEIADFKGEAYLRVRVAIDDVPPAAAAERAAAAAESTGGRFCRFQWVRRQSEDGSSDADDAGSLPEIESFRAMSPMSVAESFYLSQFDGNPMPDDLRDLFAGVCADVETTTPE